MRLETRAIGGEPRPDGRREAERIVVLAGGGVAGFSGGVGTLTLYLMTNGRGAATSRACG